MKKITITPNPDNRVLQSDIPVGSYVRDIYGTYIKTNDSTVQLESGIIYLDRNHPHSSYAILPKGSQIIITA